MGEDLLFAGLGLVMREAALFAGTGFLLLGTSDLLVDFIWIARTLRRRFTIYRRFERASAATLKPTDRPGRLALFVPAWKESGVIGEMLRSALATFRHDDYRIYVGAYPNDPATIDAVRRVTDARVRLVIGPKPGPTTKADCLNRIWEAMLGDEATEAKPVKAIVLHDAEDVVHSAELILFDSLIDRFALVQLPVLPLIDPGSRWIAGHYADEFAESHAKEMVVREALGAGLPSAGVGCAFARDALAEIAAAGGGAPFDADSLTEDYELGLRLRAMGRRAAFVRLPGERGRPVVMTREYFPCTIKAAVSQKARWMTGIALSGWDRLGWTGGVAERWMRLRDRQSVLAALFLFAAYVALLLWAVLSLRHIFFGAPPEPVAPALAALLAANFVLLGWRVAMRFGFVTHFYGWREGLRSIPRVVIGNIIAMLAARRAVMRYLGTRRSGRVDWDKTVHFFPAALPAE
ncbi:glycosyl transferase family protein [Enterovirga sp. GCM10030262]|uniref:glycosyl transferase family protein n=1 Tax=Enterovirga sp. GCM10030262 TaxID=3273391 RepID=UPI003623CFBD